VNKEKRIKNKEKEGSTSCPSKGNEEKSLKNFSAEAIP
jgi:hypothetical protein